MHECRNDLQRVVQGIPDRQAPMLCNQLADVRSVDELERDVVQAVLFADEVDARDVFMEAFLHFRELRFQFFDALLLALHPLRAQFFAFFFERVPLRGHLLLPAVQLIAAAMQIRDEVGGLARFGRQQRARTFDDCPAKSEPLRDGYAARAARHADHQAICGPQVYVVKFDRGVHLGAGHARPYRRKFGHPHEAPRGSRVHQYGRSAY